MRVLIAVTHLLGAGHLTRAAALARALAAARHSVTLVSGGAPAALVRFDGVSLVQLPPVQVRGTAFSRLLDADGQPAGEDTMAARRKVLLDALAAARPDVVVTELFPFGRRVLADEFLALVEAARADRPRPLILASIRDILVAPDKPERIATAHARIAALYDAVLVHGDPALVPLDASWPVDAGLRPRLHDTGYVDDGAPVPEPVGPRRGVLVSAGSSAAGSGLLLAAAEAARQRPDLGWRILAGQGVSEAALAEIGRGLPEGVLTRARPDYRVLLARAAVSVSACGYNTAVDLLRCRPRAVLVPFEAGQETEQRLRAERLAARGLARVLPEADLSAKALLYGVLAALADPEPAPHTIACDGAERSVAIVEGLAAGRVTAPAPARLRPGWRPLTIALDAAGDHGVRVPFWWRDDDAVAATPALDRLLGLSERLRWPLLLAAIPALAEPSLVGRLRDAPAVAVAVHGLSHADHAPAGDKPAEFGAHRPLPVLLAEAGRALRLARGCFPPNILLPVFVPPWNRVDPKLAAALPGLGYTGLSSVEGPAVACLIRADVHLDPVDWRGTRSLADVDGLIGGLARSVAAKPSRLRGILTHHLAHDDPIWGFLDDLLSLLAGHATVAIRDPRHLFAPAAVDPAWPVQALVRRARMR